MPLIERLRSAAQAIARYENLTGVPLQVEIRRLPPEMAIGNTSERDYPIWKGKEGMIEARLLDGTGQAFTSASADFDGGSSTLVAMTWKVPGWAGAVYNPLVVWLNVPPVAPS